MISHKKGYSISFLDKIVFILRFAININKYKKKPSLQSKDGQLSVGFVPFIYVFICVAHIAICGRGNIL